MAHAIARAVEREVFLDAKEARAALTGLKSSIKASGWPSGTIYDSEGTVSRPNSVLVPVGHNGYSVYRVRSNGTAELRTVLIRR